mmetsp:Transcript_43927/g.91476  ORF Transcript_43927/g.91476 Transcript_43927/m.91476 type:complete len:314 (+) Transcript_43927:61-1002(+)
MNVSELQRRAAAASSDHRLQPPCLLIPSSAIGRIAAFVLVKLVALLAGGGNLSTAIVDDLLDVCDPLAVPVVLALPMAIEESVPPIGHGVGHAILLVQDQAQVRLVKVRASLVHLLSIPEESGLLSVNVRERAFLVLCERLQLAVGALCDSGEEDLLEVFEAAEEVGTLLVHRLHCVAYPHLEVRDGLIDALLKLDFVGHEVVLQARELVRKACDHCLPLGLQTFALGALELRQDLLLPAPKFSHHHEGLILALLFRLRDSLLEGGGLLHTALVFLVHPCTQVLDVIGELLSKLLLHRRVALENREVLRFRLL